MTRSNVSGGSESLKKARGVAIWQPGHQKFSIFPACKAEGNQNENTIAFFERDNIYLLQNQYSNESAITQVPTYIFTRD